MSDDRSNSDNDNGNMKDENDINSSFTCVQYIVILQHLFCNSCVDDYSAASSAPVQTTDVIQGNY